MAPHEMAESPQQEESAAHEPQAPRSDGTALLEEALAFKEKGNALVRQRRYQEAVKEYERSGAVLASAKAYGKGVVLLSDELEQMRSLESVLHANMAQCLLNLQLYRRAIEECTLCLGLDKQNVKAYHRRSQAHEALKEWQEALRDALSVKKLGGGELDAKELERRCEHLLEQHYGDNEKASQAAGENKELFEMKARFQAVLEKYGLGDGQAAPQVAMWLATDADFKKSVERVRLRWDMSQEEAEHFAAWIQKGLDMKVIPDPRLPQGMDMKFETS
eukprot:TRINITY_DN55932_c0_g1_i1.p1 TRINITY_DN55932_c0_g1~~TRINITY_DN55932_c0_g1_i1.p1  ORF type:complete len:286 (+),score=89.37 TRINITY_DN55932_c0_g1_i1:33-860(+)